MRSAGFLAVLAIAACLMAPGAMAMAPDAQALYRDGRFLDAAQAAEARGGAADLALAARATLAYAAYVGPPAARLRGLEAGERLARAALARDPDLVEGHLQLVVALGLIARAEGTLAAGLQGRAVEARTHIQRALDLAPRSAWALAILGAWNAEIVHRAGALVAVEVYGADRDAALSALASAVAAEPENPVMRYEQARAMLMLGGLDAREAAISSLETARDRLPRDAFEGLVATRARILLDAVEAGDARRVETLVDDCPPPPSAAPVAPRIGR